MATAQRRDRWRGAVLVIPLVPTVALLSAVFLPFVNSDRLWWGMPRLFVWTAVWVLLITPTLAAVEWLYMRPRRAGEER